jgi:hypothetical protein
MHRMTGAALCTILGGNISVMLESHNSVSDIVVWKYNSLEFLFFCDVWRFIIFDALSLKVCLGSDTRLLQYVPIHHGVSFKVRMLLIALYIKKQNVSFNLLEQQYPGAALLVKMLSSKFSCVRLNQRQSFHEQILAYSTIKLWQFVNLLYIWQYIVHGSCTKKEIIISLG